ncbi:hypothetical protein SDC9_125542 [bioreactor metagenome]|uniref:Uncharacterized protein n=1 Tax=bioreactor metagenome TaxID=1076179 RepID=A0A645CNM2_9ZZZZ
MEHPLGGFKRLVGAVELAQLRRLVGKGLGGADTGQARLDIRVDGGGLPLHSVRRLRHGPAKAPNHGEKHGKNYRDHQRQPPLDGKHHRKGPHNGHKGNKHVLRPVVGQLRDVEQVGGEPAHQLAGAVFVVVTEIQLLHVVKQVPADIRLHQNAEGVPVIGDDVAQGRPQGKSRHHRRHHGEKRLPRVCGQQGIHAPPGDKGKRQIDEGHHKRATDVQKEKPPVGLEIADKNLK